MENGAVNGDAESTINNQAAERVSTIASRDYKPRAARRGHTAKEFLWFSHVIRVDPTKTARLKAERTQMSQGRLKARASTEGTSIHRLP